MLLLPTATYRAPDFVEAAREVGVDLVVASEEEQVLAGVAGAGSLVVPFDDPPEAAARIVEAARRDPVDAVVAADEAGVVPAALASRELGLPHNPPEAVAATRDKIALRRALEGTGIRQPRFRVAEAGDDVAALAREVGLPCVVKPTSLSASRGVIRADRPGDAAAAAATVRDVLRRVDPGAEAPPDPDGPLLVESYAPGFEVALEGLLVDGALRVLALLDKPDPMEGPTFAETLLVTPSRLPPPLQERVRSVAADAAAALGLSEGPVHAELRVDGDDVWFLELAARSIGGLCARALRFGTGASLEEVLLRHAARLPLESLVREETAAGVLMLPPPGEGVLEEVRGTDEALAVEGVHEVDITLRPGARVAPLPESSRYLGFVFARGSDPGAVEEALREAWRRIVIVAGTP